MYKVVLATGVEQLDRDISQELARQGVEVTGECYYREGILPCCKQKSADTVIISPELVGHTSIEKIVLSLRRSTLDIRVILLPGPEDLVEPWDLARSLLNAGVYDIVFSAPSSEGSTVNAKDVVDRFFDRAKYAEAEALLTSVVRISNGNSFMRETCSISNNYPRARADATEDRAGLADVKSCEKVDRNPSLSKLMQGVVDIISNRQKSVEDELLYSDQESGEGLAWDDEEPFVTPVEKARVSEKAVVQDDRGIPAPEKEMRRDAIVDNTDGEELSREIEDAGVDMNIEKAPRWFILDERVAEEPVLYDSNEKDSGQEEGNGESLGDLAMPDCLTFRTRKTEPEKGNICYMPHRLIAVWSPDGWAKSYTALNLAALAANKGFDTALINFDLLCPELDIWFGVRQTGIGEFEGNSAGVMTFGDGYETKKMSSFLKKRSWGIQYLPAGNKLGNICAPDFEMDAMEHALKIIYQRNTGSKPAITVVDAGRSYESVPTMAALRQAAIVLVPTDGSPVIAEIAKQQIEGLRRLGNSSRFIEVLFTTPGRKVTHICHERCSVMFDWNDYLIDRAAMKPACLRVDGRRAWDGVLNRLAPTGSGNVSRRM